MVKLPVAGGESDSVVTSVGLLVGDDVSVGEIVDWGGLVG